MIVMRRTTSMEASMPDGPLITRRRALQAVASVVAASATSGFMPGSARGEGVDIKKLPYIDAHSHLWSPDVARWPLANNQTKADLAPSSFTPEELLKLAEPEGVGKAVLIQHHIYHGWDNTYLIDCARRFPGRFTVTGMVDDAQPHPEKVMRELLPQGVRALRITP